MQLQVCLEAQQELFFFYQCINNVACKTPKIVLKRELHSREFDRDVELKADQVGAEVSKRLKLSASEPVIITIESATLANMMIIDTPGLLEEGEPGREERESAVLALAKPSHRLIVAVEASRDWSSIETQSIVRKVDPDFARSTFVYSKFNSHLQSFTSTREVNKYLAGSLLDTKAFFVSVPSAAVANQFHQSEKYREKVFQAFRRDVNALEQLQFDKKK